MLKKGKKSSSYSSMSDFPDMGCYPIPGGWAIFGPIDGVGVFQERGHLPGPESGLLSNTGKWIVWGDTCADKARDFIGKGQLGGEQEGEGAQESCSATWLEVSSFMVMGLVSRWSLANRSDSVLPGGTGITQPRWMPERRILGGGQTCSVSFWFFPDSSHWWWLSHVPYQDLLS